MADYIYLTSTGLNLRKGPDNKKRVLRTVPGNEQIQILEKTNEWWWKVEYEGTTGYIAKELIKVSYPLSIIDFGKKNPVASIVLILFLIAIVYYASSSSNHSQKTIPKKKKANKKSRSKE